MDYKRKYLMATFSNFKSTLVAAADTAAGASSAATTVVADMTALIALTGMSDGDQAFVTANNNLYFYSSGWYKIATVSNDSPTAITGVSGSYALDISGGTTTITAVSTDPEGFPLTWSYSTSGLGSIATISQSSNVFTITPSTNTANAGSFTLTINVTDGINGAVSASSTLTLQFFITNSKYTTALITAVDTSDNNNITDASSNNHTITVNGDAAAGTFSPYRNGGYSLNFPTANNRIQVAEDTNTRVLGNDFTVEGWVYVTGGNNGLRTIIAQGRSGVYSPFNVYYDSSVSKFKIDLSSSGSSWDIAGQVASSSTYSENAWHHWALVREGTAFKLYVNGSLDSTIATSSATLMTPTRSTSLGAREDGSYDFYGYMRDVRLVIGTAVYSGSSYAVPTEPLENITNTKLLLCALPYVGDKSSNSYSITQVGSLSVLTYNSLFDNKSLYSASNHGGSIYFDGTSDYLRVSEIDFGTGDFCIEGWFYSKSSSQSIVASGQTTPGATTDNVQLMRFNRGDSGNHFTAYFQNGYIFQDEASDAMAPGLWFHCALTRSAGTVRVFINGEILATNSSSSARTNSVSFTMLGAIDYGATPYDNYNGYVSDFKVTAGSAVYTSDFTPPTSPTSSSGANLHIKGTDASIIDKAQTNNVLLSGVTGSTTQAKFSNTKSIDVTSSDNYAVAQNIDGNFGSGSFTIECWIWPETLNITYAQNALGTVLDLDVSLGSGTDWWVIHQNNNGGLDFASNSANYLSSTNSVLTAQTWHHIAIVRSGSTLTWYVDGTARGTTSNSNSIGSVRDLHIGKQSGVNRYFKGYIQDVRITKGLARYTSSFTPPTSELQG